MEGLFSCLRMDGKFCQIFVAIAHSHWRMQVKSDLYETVCMINGKTRVIHVFIYYYNYVCPTTTVVLSTLRDTVSDISFFIYTFIYIYTCTQSWRVGGFLNVQMLAWPAGHLGSMELKSEKINWRVKVFLFCASVQIYDWISILQYTLPMGYLIEWLKIIFIVL